MSISFVRNDIARMDVDAVVLPANAELLKGRGASTSIFMAAGEEKLRLACSDLGSCDMGECKVTPGFDLPARYILHAVVPLWEGGESGEEEYLRSAYRNSLIKAKGLNLDSIAFPVLSSGNFGYPKEEALDIAVSEISDFLEDHEMEVYVVLFGESLFRAAAKLTDSIEEYIDDNYVEEQENLIYPSQNIRISNSVSESEISEDYIYKFKDLARIDVYEEEETECMECMVPDADIEPDLKMPCGAAYMEVPMFDPEKSFVETLFDRIDERGLTDPQCYNRSNIDRKLFNKIKNSPGYTPKKNNILALCIGLRLSLPEAEDLLKRAGYALSPCSRFDLAVKFFIETGRYDSIHDVNIQLYDMFGETLN